jgi:proteasome accessory factor C
VKRTLDTAGRLRRLLAMLAWLAQVGEAPIDDVAKRFDLTPEALVTELELAACCGLPPYTPDQLMEIVVTETTVSTRLGNGMSRPRRLSPREGFALAASARALLAVEGSDTEGVLSRALAKLDRALGGERLVVELDAPAWLPTVRDAAAQGTKLAISYYSASNDRETEREIAPLRVFTSEGHWYVDAHCELAQDIRRFRVDRIGEARPMGGSASATGDAGRDLSGDIQLREGSEGFDTFVPGADARTVRLELDPDTAWLVDSIPTVAVVEGSKGRLEVELVVGGDAWLERLLLRLGPGARVVDPPEDRRLGADAAARILRRYGTNVTDTKNNERSQ